MSVRISESVTHTVWTNGNPTMTFILDDKGQQIPCAFKIAFEDKEIQIKKPRVMGLKPFYKNVDLVVCKYKTQPDKDGKPALVMDGNKVLEEAYVVKADVYKLTLEKLLKFRHDRKWKNGYEKV